jgi:hypothetical protein
MIRWALSLRPCALVLGVAAVAALGCEPAGDRVATEKSPEPEGQRNNDSLPVAYQNSQTKIDDPRLIEEARRFKEWVLKERDAASRAPVFSRAEILPATQTVLPYGVGAFEQEPRLPAILTTGPGWAALTPDAKEALVTNAFVKLSEGLRALHLTVSPRPTLTIQTPKGLVLAWINDLVEGRKNLHGEEQ